MGLRVLFFGNDRFSLYGLRPLVGNLKGRLENGMSRRIIDRLEVVCAPDAARGRGHVVASGLVKDFSLREGLTVHQVDHPSSLREWVPPFHSDGSDFDIGVVVSFRYFLPRRIIRLAGSWGCVNVHPSLLPRFRGPAPIQHTILHGDLRAGLSLMEISDRQQQQFDVGDVLDQVEVPLPDAGTIRYADLERRLGEVGSDRLMGLLQKVALLQDAGGTAFSDADRTPQADLAAKFLAGSDDPASHAPKIPKEQCVFLPTQMTAEDADRRFRAFGEETGIWCICRPADASASPVRIRLWRTTHVPLALSAFHPPPPRGKNDPPGTARFNPSDGAIHVLCRDSTVLAIRELQPESRNRMSAHAFLLGQGRALASGDFAVL